MALTRRASELESYARQKGLDLSDEPPLAGPVVRIGRLADRLGIDLHVAFDMERDLAEVCRRSPS